MSIDASAAECTLLFESIRQVPGGDDVKQECESLIFRFNIWCENDFIIAPTRVSMDWRLRDAPLLESAMVELLDDLKSDLNKQTTTIVKHNRLVLPTADVRRALGRLWRLSRAIRRSGALHGFLGVVECVEYDKNWLELVVEFRKRTEATVESRLKACIASEGLKRRIFDTICLRQKHFAYLRVRYQRKHSTSHLNDFSPSTVPRSSSDMASLTGPPAPSSRTISAKKWLKGSKSDLSSMATTSTQSERGKAVHSQESASASDDDESSCIDDNLPPPPNVSSHFAQCPYCFSVCSSEEFSDARWKTHILQDLMPYVCVLEPCLTPNKVYESEENWINHMKTQHAFGCWTCMDSSHGKGLVFHEGKAFRSHMQQYHLDQFDSKDLDDLVAACYQKLPREDAITECPFCTRSEGHSDNVDLIKHVAGHLISFARISWEGHDLGGSAEFGQTSSTKSSKMKAN
ncbi:hypothetical protein BJX96DRAFT_133061 [Aspergillus floccosus]